MQDLSSEGKKIPPKNYQIPPKNYPRIVFGCFFSRIPSRPVFENAVNLQHQNLRTNIHNFKKQRI